MRETSTSHRGIVFIDAEILKQPFKIDLMIRPHFIAFLSLAFTACSLNADAPNLIVIMADDLGYADVGFNGGKDIPTPHIDTLAAQGVVCSSAYVTYPVCGPSRAGFITGRYQGRFGFGRNPQYRTNDPNMGLPLSEETIADHLRKAGYTSGIVGKWHLGAHDDLHPLNRGFDFFYGHLGGGHNYFQELLTIRESKAAMDEPDSYKTWILRNHEPERIEKYLTDAFTDEAVAFIEKNKDGPFFLFLSYNAPHTPMQAPAERIERFSTIENKKRRTYAAMVSIVDDGVGRVLDTLKALEIEEETLVVFLSDNGGATRANAANNKPLRGQKSDVWEGGWRVPFVVQWPGTLPAGKRYTKPVSSMDILATIVDLNDLKVAKDRPLDGVNLVPYLKGRRLGRPHDVLYLRKFDQQHFALRRGDYKLVIPNPELSPRLFDLSKDLSEQENIADWNDEIVEELEWLRKDFEKELMDPRFLGLIHTDAWKNRKGK
jgi:arylsulfatase A-like enzyme